METIIKKCLLKNVILTCSLSICLFMSCKNHSIINTFVKDKNIFVTDASGSIKQITFKGKDKDPIITQDFKAIYFVRETGSKVEKDNGAEELICIMKVDLENSTEEKICDHIINEDWVKSGMSSDITIDSLTNIENLSISAKDEYLFFETQKWAVSSVLVKLNIKTKETKEISPSNKFDLIKDGEFKDNIIVNKSYIKENEGRQWSNWLIDFDGKVIKEIGDENSVIMFLETYTPTLKSTATNEKTRNSSSSFEQSNSGEYKEEKIENFFIPTNGKNVSEFVLLDENGNKTDNKTSISFVKLDDNSFKTSTTNSLMEEVKQSLNDYNRDVKSYSTYLIKNDELQLVSKDFFNVKKGERELVDLNPIEVILKLPKKSNITQWKSEEISGDQYNCTSEFITLEIDRVKKRAIKLTKRIIAEDNSTDWINSITYYVEGIGEWKKCMEKTGQVVKLLYRQYSTSKSTNEEMPNTSSSFNPSGRSESKAEKIETVQGEKTILQNKDEEVSFQKVVMSWNEAHNTNDMVLFSDLFTDEVNFYHTILPRNVLVQNKKDLLKKYPDFNQQIIGDITTERLNANEVKCSFTKEVTINRKVTDYPSYLILKKSTENWKISVEGDLITDKNIAKKKSVN